MSMFLPEGFNQASAPSGVADITPPDPETTSADIALMQRVLSAASRNPNLIPADFMSYMLDWIQTQRLQIPLGQIPGFPQTTQMVRATKTSAQSIPTATWTTVTFDSEDFDQPNNNMHDNVTNNSRLVCPGTGKYVPSLNIDFAANATGVRAWRLKLNGASLNKTVSQLNTVTGGGDFAIGISYGPMSFSAGDYLELEVFQDSGGSLNLSAAGTAFSLARTS